MTDKTREVYKETPYKELPALNPFVDMPRMRVDAVNRINELIERNNKMAIVQADISGYLAYECPRCKKILPKFSGSLDYNFCHHCGQRLMTDTIAF